LYGYQVIWQKTLAELRAAGAAEEDAWIGAAAAVEAARQAPPTTPRP
jgi:hypothetical protein